jgi:hypothetical protein
MATFSFQISLSNLPTLRIKIVFNDAMNAPYTGDMCE